MTCPTCGAKVVKDPAAPSKLFPFCSQRCHLIDLGRWLGEEYRIPGPPLLDGAANALASPSSDEE